MRKLQFKPRLAPTLALLCGLALFVHLGLWQQGKGERLARDIAQHEQRVHGAAQRMDGALVDPTRADAVVFTVRGTYEPAHQFFLDNRQENGRPGVHVLTPLKIEGSETRVLVNRGWTGWTQGRQTLPVVAAPEGLQVITGRAAVPSTKKFFLMPDRAEAASQLWARVDLQRFAVQWPQPLQPVMLLQDEAAAADGLVRHWPPPEDRVTMHLSYSLQWFGMAFALIVFYGFASVRRAVVDNPDSR